MLRVEHEGHGSHAQQSALALAACDLTAPAEVKTPDGLQVFTTNGERDVSWLEMLPAMSLQMMESGRPRAEPCVRDVGEGGSRLV